MAFSYLQSATSTADTNAYTFSSQSLGDAASDRYIIVTAIARKAGAAFTLSSITIGGVSATIVRQVTNTVTNSDTAAIVIANVPTGTTGDVVVTWSTTVLRCAIGMWRATSLSSATEHDASTSTAADPTYAIDVPAGGFAIAAGLTAAATTVTWTGLTEKFDSTLESFVTYTGASDEFATTQTNLTVTMDFGSSTESAGVFASWGVAASSLSASVSETSSISESVSLSISNLQITTTDSSGVVDMATPLISDSAIQTQENVGITELVAATISSSNATAIENSLITENTLVDVSDSQITTSDLSQISEQVSLDIYPLPDININASEAIHVGESVRVILPSGAYDYVMYRYSGSVWVKAKMRIYSGSSYITPTLNIYRNGWGSVDVSG